MIRTTETDFKAFKKYAEDWINKLQLVEWNILFRHADTKDAYARTHWSTSDGQAVITLATKWDDIREKNNVELKKLALHEVLHVMTASLVSAAEYRYSTQADIDIAEHALIRRLENLFT